jgi:4-oxalocrotonate tautomerase
MPIITIAVPEGSLTPEKKASMISLVTDAVAETEGFPEARANTFITIQEVQDGGWGIGGRAVTLEMMKRALQRPPAG